jgi:hypothetical protein
MLLEGIKFAARFVNLMQQRFTATPRGPMFNLSQVHFALPLIPFIIGSISILMLIRATMRLRSIVSQKRLLQAQEKVEVINDILEQVKAIGLMQKMSNGDTLVQQQKDTAKAELEQLLARYQSLEKIHNSSNSGVKV